MIKKLFCLLGLHKWQEVWRSMGVSGIYMNKCRRCGKWQS